MVCPFVHKYAAKVKVYATVKKTQRHEYLQATPGLQPPPKTRLAYWKSMLITFLKIKKKARRGFESLGGCFFFFYFKFFT